MPFLLAVLSALAAFSYYFFIIRRSASAASEAIDAVGGAIGRTRWWYWKKKNVKPPHELIDDPILSATALILSLLRIEGELSEKHWTFIRSTLSEDFSVPIVKVDEIIAQARFSIHQMRDVSRFFQKQGVFLKGFLDEDEQAQLVEILNTAVSIEGEPVLQQSEPIARLIRIFQQ